MQIVSPRVLEQVLNSGPAPRLVDVRDPWEFDLCRIAGSENIPMAELMGRLDALGKEDPIVVICHHGAQPAGGCVPGQSRLQQHHEFGRGRRRLVTGGRPGNAKVLNKNRTRLHLILRNKHE